MEPRLGDKGLIFEEGRSFHDRRTGKEQEKDGNEENRKNRQETPAGRRNCCFRSVHPVMDLFLSSPYHRHGALSTKIDRYFTVALQ